MSRATVLLWMLILPLTGCLGPSAPTSTEVHPSGLEHLLHISLSDVSQEQGGVQLIFDAPADSNLNLHFQSNQTLRQDPASWACGFVAFATAENGHREKEQQFGNFLSFSKGHAVMLARDSAPLMVNRSGANENLFLSANDDQQVGGLHVKAGQQVILEAAYAASQGTPPPLAAMLNLTAESGLRLNRTVPFWFRCGANLEQFKGTFATQGFGPSAVTIVNASAEYEAPTPTFSNLLLYGDKRFASACTATVTFAGRPVATSGAQTNVCSAYAKNPPGRVGFRIENTVMSGPFISYFVQGFPPGLVPP